MKQEHISGCVGFSNFGRFVTAHAFIPMNMTDMASTDDYFVTNEDALQMAEVALKTDELVNEPILQKDEVKVEK